jgi:small conductance mechanosensitive channel
LEGALVVGLKIIAALVIYYIGRWIVRRVMKFMDKIYEKKSVEKSLRSFLSGVVKVLLYVVIVLIIIQVLGINTTSLVAMLASAGLAIGMALSGTLQNFAGGVMILLLRPYRIGDYIDAQGEEGTVRKIGLFSTEIITVDNRIIYIPNSTISTSVIDNYSTSEMRRVDWTVSVEYGTDPEKVRKVLVDMLKSDSRVAADPAPVVFLVNLADSSVDFSARAWCKNEDYWGLKFDIQERIYVELPKNDINFPFPQLDVNLKK